MMWVLIWSLISTVTLPFLITFALFLIAPFHVSFAEFFGWVLVNSYFTMDFIANTTDMYNRKCIRNYNIVVDQKS